MKKRVPDPECLGCGWKGELVVKVVTSLDATAKTQEQHVAQLPVVLLGDAARQCVLGDATRQCIVLWQCPNCKRTIEEHMHAGLLEDVKED